MKSGTTSLHIYPTTFEYESRILKITESLVKNNVINKITVIAKSAPGLPAEYDLDDNRHVSRIVVSIASDKFWLKILAFFEWSFRILVRFRKSNVDYVNCHSLSVLPLCVLLKVTHRAKLIYEPHELETETATFTGYKKKIAKIVEKNLIRFADKVIVVSDNIGQKYMLDYGITDVDVIMNVPRADTSTEDNGINILKERLNIPDKEILFMYQGALGKERGVGELLDAFKRVDQKRHIVFMGFGELEPEIIRASKKYKNIHFHSAVQPEEIMKYSMCADVGFALLSDTCLNHEYALPNKFFHYIHAGIPVVTSNLEAMRSIVERYKCGWIVQDNSVSSIEGVVNAIEMNDVNSIAGNVQTAKEKFSWELEERKLLEIYNEL